MTQPPGRPLVAMLSRTWRHAGSTLICFDGGPRAWSEIRLMPQPQTFREFSQGCMSSLRGVTPEGSRYSPTSDPGAFLDKSYISDSLVQPMRSQV